MPALMSALSESLCPFSSHQTSQIPGIKVKLEGDTFFLFASNHSMHTKTWACISIITLSNEICCFELYLLVFLYTNNIQRLTVSIEALKLVVQLQSMLV